MSIQSAETAACELLTDIGLTNVDAIPFVKCYHLNSNSQIGLLLGINLSQLWSH